MSAPAVGRYFLFPETQDALMAVSQKRRDELAAKRAKQSIEDRRIGERRLLAFDRRSADRRSFATMEDKLAAEANKHDGDRKYTGAALSDFGGLK